MKVQIYHNPNCGTSRNVLAMLEASGKTPEVIEYLRTPPSRERLEALLAMMKITPRALLRRKGFGLVVVEGDLGPWEELQEQVLVLFQWGVQADFGGPG